MYYGIIENEGKRISDYDAFSYACEKLENGSAEDQQKFMSIAKDSESFSEFAKRIVEWFYSGSWIYGF